VKVHPEILAGEKLPKDTLKDPDFWQHRYRAINDLEKYLYANGTRVVKFFLHLSKEEQRKRFLARIKDPDKNWKFSQDDIAERNLWPKYMAAYEACLSATSTGHAPWYVIPADDKQNARIIISQVVLETLKELKMDYPKPSKSQLKELKAIRKLLLK
jgi:polyphosphate kinase 2 (PPK2 family)